MIAVLLCAGYATRLYPLTRSFPKPLLPVADKPVIDYLVDQIAVLPTIDTLHIVTNAKFYDHFRKWAGQKAAAGAVSIPIIIHNDKTSCNAHRLGAVADLQLVLKSLPSPQPMLVAAADNIFRFSFAGLCERFLREKRHLVVALPQTDRHKLQKTGVLALDDEDQVLRLHEKPIDPPSTWSCPPLYFLRPSAIGHLDTLLATENQPDAPGHFIEYLCRREPVMAQRLDGTRLDIGDIDSYHDADKRLRCEPLFP
ncbi:MAG: nucleotidyltransferase family protein [Desulfobacterales bacterium]|nr:nucleotidyltransferase family protein [Desulfobacterales bacterium]